MAIEALKNQLQTAEKKLAFFKKKELQGGLSLDQEFKLSEDIIAIEAQIDELRKQIAKSYGLDSQSGQTILADKIRTLSITEDIGEIHLVNCNREAVADSFWEAFDLKLEGEVPFQFYFVPACPTQQPDSFTERMIIEIILDELDEEEDAILCLRGANNRLMLEDLPLGRNLKRSQKAFAKYFSKRFELGDKTMEQYLETGLPKLEYDYVATVFEVFAEKWKDFTKEYLEWIINQFKSPNDEVPTFLFFFVVYIYDIHKESVKAEFEEIKDELQSLQIKHLEVATMMKSLKPVERQLVESWIRDLGERNQSKIGEIVDILVAGLKQVARKQYDTNQTLNMTDIERFQELVYKIANE
ncbi:MAG: hypothetical protein AB8G11_06330 [Saprospiraceae bacterium]